MNQSQFAELIGVDQSVISRAITAGILTKDADWTIWVKQLTRHYIESAAGRRGNGTLDIVQERARWSAAMADKTEFELKKHRAEFIPLNLTLGILNHANGIIRSRLLALPHRLKSLVRELTPKAVMTIDNLIREALTELSSQHFPAEIHSHLSAWIAQGKNSGQDIPLAPQPPKTKKARRSSRNPQKASVRP